jgi:hypothetical protein
MWLMSDQYGKTWFIPHDGLPIISPDIALILNTLDGLAVKEGDYQEGFSAAIKAVSRMIGVPLTSDEEWTNQIREVDERKQRERDVLMRSFKEQYK